MQKKLHHKFHTKLISYDQFMEYKLYDENDGYYSENNQELWGTDYMTSPIIHPAFGFLIAKYIYAVWISMNSPSDFSLIEIGGGNLNLTNNIFEGIQDLSSKFAVDSSSNKILGLDNKALMNAIFCICPDESDLLDTSLSNS